MKYVFLVAIFLFLGTSGLSSEASETVGTITSSNKTIPLCKNTACSSFSTINMAPTVTAGQVFTITDSGITGYMWGSELGFINMKPTGYGVSVNPTTGVLSGYAWSQNGGWVNFSPTTVSGQGNVGVTIGTDGKFSGYAWVSGIDGGWMKFDCSVPTSCVGTDWRPIGVRGIPTGGGGGGGGGGNPLLPPKTSPTPTPTPSTPPTSGPIITVDDVTTGKVSTTDATSLLGGLSADFGKGLGVASSGNLPCYDYIDTTVYQNSKKNNKQTVLRLERFLNVVIKAKLKENGIYETADKKAIIKFQELYGLKSRGFKGIADGIVGPRTQFGINMVSCRIEQINQDKLTNKKTVKLNPIPRCPYQFASVAKVTTDETKKTQKFLGTFYKYNGVVDGKFSAPLTNEILKLQKRFKSYVYRKGEIPKGAWDKNTISLANLIIGCVEK